MGVACSFITATRGVFAHERWLHSSDSITAWAMVTCDAAPGASWCLPSTVCSVTLFPPPLLSLLQVSLDDD